MKRLPVIYTCFPGGKFKVLTMSYDDGKKEDYRLVDLFNKHGIKGTFNLNAGIDWDERRIPMNEYRTLYEGHEVACHTFTHPTIARCPLDQVARQVLEDREGLEQLIGKPVRGLAYPNGSYSKEIMDLLPALVVAAALLDGPVEGVILGVTVGLFYDLGFIGIDGLYPIFFVLFGLVAGVISQLTLSGSYVSMLIMTSIEMIVLGLMRFFVYLLPQAGASFALVLQQIIGGTVLTCVFSFAVYLPMHRISRTFAER